MKQAGHKLSPLAYLLCRLGLHKRGIRRPKGWALSLEWACTRCGAGL